MAQLVLDLPFRPALGREDFLVTPANAAAVAMIDQWPSWPHHAVALAGPPGSGKSHLVEVWRKAGGVEAIDDLPGEPLDETALFHKLNRVKQEQGTILLSSRMPPSAWGVKLPDLASRLKAIPVIILKEPDDELLRGVLVKHFADRQIAVDASLISYLMARMPRSLEAARALVELIDRKALEEKAEVTRPFAAKVLAGYAEPWLLGED